MVIVVGVIPGADAVSFELDDEPEVELPPQAATSVAMIVAAATGNRLNLRDVFIRCPPRGGGWRAWGCDGSLQSRGGLWVLSWGRSVWLLGRGGGRRQACSEVPTAGAPALTRPPGPRTPKNRRKPPWIPLGKTSMTTMSTTP